VLVLIFPNIQITSKSFNFLYLQIQGNQSIGCCILFTGDIDTIQLTTKFNAKNNIYTTDILLP